MLPTRPKDFSRFISQREDDDDGDEHNGDDGDDDGGDDGSVCDPGGKIIVSLKFLFFFGF